MQHRATLSRATSARATVDHATPNHPGRARTLSLVTPSGPLTLGNYVGALRRMRRQQDESECFFGVSDLHALTVPHDPRQVGAVADEIIGLFLAVGLDPDRCTLFVQSQVPAHSQLAYLLECTATMGELNRMIQFKEKGRGRPESRVSLFTYPTLMAADILLYGATEVPVGDDQRQHVEITRDLASRFNHRYGEVFTIPRIVTPAVGARVMDLQEPRRKMSKSRDAAGTIHLLDGADTVRRKVRRAVTDSGADVTYSADRPGVANLLDILSACTDGRDPRALATVFESCSRLKDAVAEAVIGVLEPIRHAYAVLDPAEVQRVRTEGAEHARTQAQPVLEAARAAIGLR